MNTLTPTRPAGIAARPVHPHRKQLSVGILSTYPPTQCGLATFSAALVNGLHHAGVIDIGVVSVGDDAPTDSPRVIGHLIPRDVMSISRVAQLLNQYDIVIVQHEYGIYGGEDGEEVLEVMRRLRAPVIVTLHTVLLQPTAHQKHILEAVIDEADVAVTMTAIARQRLLGVYTVDPSRVAIIPHGATIPLPVAPAPEHSPLLLTWGLLGPGKGIEWVIEALAMLGDDVPTVNYVVAGQTHPKVKAQHGEQYRRFLQDLVRRHGLQDRVEFDSTYRTVDSLLDLIARSTCVVLPYESIDQITSGVLVDAVTAGRPVVSTAFPHAIELLSGGAGMLVPPRNPEALSKAIRKVVTNSDLVQLMSQRAASLAPMHDWASVASTYKVVGESLLQTASLKAHS
jgi:glycosyltransferase involved in cell wall biosynthesis